MTEMELLKVWFYDVNEKFKDGKGFQMGAVVEVESLEELIPDDRVAVVRRQIYKTLVEVVNHIGVGALRCASTGGLLDCEYMVGLCSRFDSSDRSIV
uniref:Uncharacterized protein n=1 Tax=viral metagenome TaxID=1070528 RepID=A0A6M3M817_9ZZZZ